MWRVQPNFVGSSFLILKIMCNIITYYRYANTKRGWKRYGGQILSLFPRLPLSESSLSTYLFSLLRPILVQSKIPREKITSESQISLNIQPSSTLQVMYKLLSRGSREVLSSSTSCDSGCALHRVATIHM